MIEKIKGIAAANPEGFTITIPTCEFVHSGYVIAMFETQNSFGDEGLQMVIAQAMLTTGMMGGWDDEGLFYWDAVYIIHDRDEAMRIGRENQQIAIFHLDSKDLIYL